MTKVFFSSWNSRIVDERNKKEEERTELTEIGIPKKVENKEIKAFIGWAGLVIIDPQYDPVRALKEYYYKMQDESCGRCIPCRVGSRVIADRLNRLVNGEGTEGDLGYLKEIATLVREGSLCELGISSPVPLLHALEYFEENFKTFLHPDKTEPDKTEEYRSILSAPCRNGCPAHINIPKYIECIKEGNYEEALAVNREKTPLVGTLGRVCVHPCESNCNRQPVDQALSIRLLKRFVADFGRKNGYDATLNKPTIDQNSNQVAVIGAGPAGINAAYQLALKGYRVTIFEALPIAGGMLAVGIPSYRLPRDILNAEIDFVKSLGVEIRLNVKVGVDISLDQIREEGFKAIFIATGLHDSAVMGCEGEEECYYGYMPGVEFLRKINLGQKVDLGDKVAVIGGGNVAMDCARSAVRMGVKEVHLVYRRSRNEMPANKAEIDAAEEEGVIFHMLANPTVILEKSGCVSGMECIKMELGEPDASGRRRPVPLKGSEFILAVDNIIPAIGQVADFCFLNKDCGMTVTDRGTLEVDKDTFASNEPGIFAGGDAVLGARTVIEAIATANRAAEAIDSYLKKGKVRVGYGRPMERQLESMGVYSESNVPEMIGNRTRLEEAVCPAEIRKKGFDEAELGFQRPAEVTAEAARCVKCLRLGMVVLEQGGTE
ncbi:MAG: FAD-dependent oxidoreductase [Bacillota bacterium]|nr:FAD-dependent oxidoreductase [Bacillota bacterium]